MKYKCENELQTLSFKDFAIMSITYENNKLTIMTSGGIARYDNSCNETLEERYISDTEITFFNATIDRFYLEGGKYYTADDVLVQEIPDTDFVPDQYKNKLKMLTSEEEAVIFFLAENRSGDKPFYEIAVDVVNDTYWLMISADKVTASFDRFMNRVMN